jgi:hypothetical protein
VFAPGLPDPAFHLQQGEYLFPALTNGGSPLRGRKSCWLRTAAAMSPASKSSGEPDRGNQMRREIGDLKGALTCA